MACSTGEGGFERALARFMKRLTPAEKDQFRFSRLEDVHDVIHDIQESQGSEGNMRNLARIQAFVEAMEQYGKIVEVFLNAAELLAFIWGPVKFLLQIASTWAESLDTLLDAYDQISENIPQFLQYESLFRNNLHMRKVLELIYGDILEFHRRALNFFKCRTWKKLFHATWKTFHTQFQYILSSLSRHKVLVESQASLEEYEQSQAARLVAQNNFDQIAKAERNRRFLAITEKIHAATSLTDHEYLLEILKEYPRTGRWILDCATLKDWMNPSSTKVPLLWLNGIPGAGKTVLTSLIIEEAQKLDSVTVAFFYCKYSDIQKNSFTAVLRGLLLQLIQQNENLLSFVHERCASSSEVTLESPTLLKELLETSLRSCSNVYLLLDGLDECEVGEEKRITAWFTALVAAINKENPGAIRLLIISQRTGVLEKVLAKAPVLSMETQDHQDDIERYSQIWAVQIQKKFDIPAAAASDIAAKVAERAEGLFLYAKLVLANLYSQTSRARLNKEIEPDSFPTGLEAAYERIVHRVFDNPNKSEREDAGKLISWIACAKRPLKWHEVQGLFSIDIGSATVEFDDRRLRVTSRDLCGSLVETRSGDGIELVHRSAKIYMIETSRISILTQELNMAKFCLRYLSLNCFDADLADEDIRAFILKGYYGFEDYAMVHWIDHLVTGASEVSADDALTLRAIAEGANVFLSKHPVDLSSDIAVPDPIVARFRGLEGSELHRRLALLQYLADQKKSSENHIDLETQLQRRRSILEQLVTNADMESLLSERLSLFYGSRWYKCTKLWCHSFYEGFSRTERRNEHIDQHERPFRCSAVGCPAEKIGFAHRKQLMKHVASSHPTIPDTQWHFPTLKRKRDIDFFQAAEAGLLDVVQNHLENGVDVNQTSKPRGAITALYLASKNNQSEVVDYLVRNGASTNISKGGVVSPLEVAVNSGHSSVARLLLRHGASMNVETSMNREIWRRVLLCAARENDEIMLSLLLEYGAAIKSKSNRRAESALHYAVSNDKETLMRALLSKNADVGARDKKFMTPLHVAALRGDKSALNLLLERGSHIEAQSWNKMTPLHLIACGGRSAVTALFASMGDRAGRVLRAQTNLGFMIEPESRGINEAYFGAPIVRKFLDSADVEVGRDPCNSVVNYATNSHKYVMSATELLKLGANVAAKLEDRSTALHWGALRGDLAMVQLFLDHGAEGDTKDQHHRTALHWAASKGCRDVVQLLLTRTANINDVDLNFETALDMAGRGLRISFTSQSTTAMDLALQQDYESSILVFEGLLQRDRTPFEKEIGHSNITKQDSHQSQALHDYQMELILLEQQNKKRLLMQQDEKRGKGIIPFFAKSLVKRDFEGVIDLLLANGADSSHQNMFGETMLHTAAMNGHEDLVQQILTHHTLDLDSHDKTGRTAWYYARENGHGGVVRILEEKGASTEEYIDLFPAP